MKAFIIWLRARIRRGPEAASAEVAAFSVRDFRTEMKAVATAYYECPDPHCGGFTWTREPNGLMTGTGMTPQEWHKQTWGH